MTYDSSVLALAPRNFWRLDDSGNPTNPVDAGSASQNLAKNGDFAFGATPVISEYERAASMGNGMAYFDATNGNGLHPTTDFSVMGLIALDTAQTAGAYQHMLGWSTNLASIGLSNQGAVQAAQSTQGGTVPTNWPSAASMPIATFGAGALHHFYYGWSLTDGPYPGVGLFLIDGVYAGHFTRDYSPGTATARFAIGTNVANIGTKRFNAVSFHQRQLTAAEVRDCVAQIPEIQPPVFGDHAESILPGPSRALGFDGGHLRRDDRARTTINTRTWRTDQAASHYATRQAKFVTTGNLTDEIRPACARYLMEFLLGTFQRVTANGTDGSSWLGNDNILRNANASNVLAEVVGAPILLHHATIQATGEGDATLVRWTKSFMQRIFDTQDQATGEIVPGTDSDDFHVYQYSFALLLLAPYIDGGTFSLWRSKLERAMEFNYQKYKLYAVNGNRDLQMAVAYYTWWKVTNNPLWYSRWTEKWALVRAPTTAIGSGSGGNAQAKGFGLRNYVTGLSTDNASDPLVSSLSALDPASDKVYFAESTNAGGGSLVGCDWDYLMNQLGIAVRYYHVSGRDPDAAKLVACMVNCAWQRVNTTTWVYDFTNGTRHTGSGTRAELPWEIAQLENLGSVVGSTDLAPHLPIAMNAGRAGFRGLTGVNIFRHAVEWYAGVLMTDPSFSLPDTTVLTSGVNTANADALVPVRFGAPVVPKAAVTFHGAPTISF